MTMTLREAAKTGALAEVQRLLDAGASMDARSSSDMTPLHEASYNGPRSGPLVAQRRRRD